MRFRSQANVPQTIPIGLRPPHNREMRRVVGIEDVNRLCDETVSPNPLVMLVAVYSLAWRSFEFGGGREFYWELDRYETT